MTPEYRVAALWIGGPLSFLEQLCLISFVHAGQHITLYTYEPVPNVPPGVEAATWLDGLRPSLRPAPDAALVGTPASPRANDVRNDDPACLVASPTLFA